MYILPRRMRNKGIDNIVSSRFTTNINIRHPHPEYPRPQFARSPDSWMNLNGEWNIQFLDENLKGEKEYPIIVPFSPESYLSGVSKQILPSQTARYSRSVDLTEFYDPKKSNERLLLHFGAVDQVSWVYINDRLIGNNTNGYIPFSFDISAYVVPGNNAITVLVQDTTELSTSMTGKQRIDRGGTFYTAQSGIWQTVWLEKVPSVYIKSISVNPVFTPKESYVDFFHITLAGIDSMEDISLSSKQNQHDFRFQIDIYSKDRLIYTNISHYSFSSQNSNLVHFAVPQSEVQKWTPSSPFLYTYNITLLHSPASRNDSKSRPQILDDQNSDDHTSNDQTINDHKHNQDFQSDVVSGYFALRSFTKDIDENGVPRIFLNGEPYFQLGVLDQGYWSDGLMTPPTDHAFVWDIQFLKAMGFNMIREHAKIAPLRFYYHCDRLGMIVWQDMVPGFGAKDQSEHRKAVVRLLRDTPCICTWTLFNQDWGKYADDASKALKEVKELDYGKRLIDTYSGGKDDYQGDFISLHCYRENLTNYLLDVQNEYYNENSGGNKANGRIFALTEFGGLELNVYLNKNHNSHLYGMFPFRRRYDSKGELMEKYKDLMLNQLLPLVKTRLSATVFTQLSDIEAEMNGLVTFNRKYTKFNVMELAEINRKFKFPFE